MIAIMVNSAAGISQQEAEQLGAHYVPMTYTVDRQQFVEHYIGENGQFEPYIERDDVERRTSQASASAFITAFERQLAKGRQVLCITISSRLSGTYANAVMAAKEVNADEIKVLDSRNCAGGIYFLINIPFHVLHPDRPFARSYIPYMSWCNHPLLCTHHMGISWS